MYSAKSPAGLAHGRGSRGKSPSELSDVSTDGDLSPGGGNDDLSLLGSLYKRKDFLDKEEGAKSHPNRTYYYRRRTNVDVDKLIASCTRKLARDKRNSKNPNAKALYIRASCFMKKQAYAEAVSDYSAALGIDKNDVASLVS